jgi:hypothetical protein
MMFHTMCFITVCSTARVTAAKMLERRRRAVGAANRARKSVNLVTEEAKKVNSRANSIAGHPVCVCVCVCVCVFVCVRVPNAAPRVSPFSHTARVVIMGLVGEGGIVVVVVVGGGRWGA